MYIKKNLIDKILLVIFTVMASLTVIVIVALYLLISARGIDKKDGKMSREQPSLSSAVKKDEQPKEEKSYPAPVPAFEDYSHTQSSIDSHNTNKLTKDREEGIKGIKIAIIIDDLGWNIELAKDFMEADSNISLAVIPNLRFSKDIAVLANRSGFDVLLHLPMEPHGYPAVNSGKGSILAGMKGIDIKRIVADDLSSIPFVSGVNNHMGSRLCEEKEEVRAIMDILKDRGVFFVDSLTTEKSICYQTAKDMGIPAAKRSVFLDNKEDTAYILNQLDILKNTAEKTGSAIGIGHPHRETLEALNKALVRFKKEGIEIVPVSKLVR